MDLLSMGHPQRSVRYYLWMRHFEELGRQDIADVVRHVIIATKAQPPHGLIEQHVDLRHLAPVQPPAEMQLSQPEPTPSAPTSPEPTCKPPLP